jgi:hypothetical protein
MWPIWKCVMLRKAPLCNSGSTSRH